MEASSEAANSAGVGNTLFGSDDPPENSPKSTRESPPAPPNPTEMPRQLKKKRGRPRKHGPDGIVAILSPKPISAAAPPPPSMIDFSSANHANVNSSSFHSKTKYPPGNLSVPCSVGANFTPHILTVNAGEDVTMKIISFSQQGPRAICVLSATGVISSVTLRQADSSGGTITYEGRFEILSLSGSFIPNDTGGTRSRAGGMSVSLASPDGRVVGGGIAGLLIAATPIQVVVGSFLVSHQQEQKLKKQKQDFIFSTPSPKVSAVPISRADPAAATSSPLHSGVNRFGSREKLSEINHPLSG